MILNAIAKFFHKLIYGILKVLADISDTIITLMRMLLGMSPVRAGDNSNLTLATVFSDATFYAFIAVVAIAVITTFIFAIIRIIKNSISDEKDDGAISKGKAWKEILRSALNIAIIPLFVYSLIMAITGVGQAIDIATSDTVISDYGAEIVFSIVDKDTLTEEGRNYYEGVVDNKNGKNYQIFVLRNGEENTAGSVDSIDLVQLTGMSAIKHLWSGDPYYNSAGIKQENLYGKDYDKFCELVDDDKYMGNFFLPLLGGCVIVVALGLAIIIVAQRLFYCAFLFIISPFIISTRPLDDGARWRKWLEIFLSKLIGAYGIIICLNVFFLLSGYLTNNITYFESGLANGIAKTLIYASGVVAAAGASQLVAQLIGGDAGQAERDNMQNNFRSIALGGHMTSRFAHGAGSIAGKAGEFFGGKRPLQNASSIGANGGSALKSVLSADNASGMPKPQTLQGESMAEKIGNTLMGKNSTGDVLKSTKQNIANSRIGRIGKGIGVFTAGVVSALPLAIKHKKDMGKQLKAVGMTKKEFKVLSPQQKKDTLAQSQKILNAQKTKTKATSANNNNNNNKK